MPKLERKLKSKIVMSFSLITSNLFNTHIYFFVISVNLSLNNYFSILTAQNPTTFNAIEVFPGAKIDPEKSKYEKELFDEIYSDSPTIKAKDIKVFVTDAPVDEVAGWFNKKLKAVDYNAD